eukprot:CAMPEP_0170354716 /NCGR_PEP_ID=MMETSP0117_2-20130122/257_1 /TAXON_ID=400756 /ORGANISM="Durinskia baltica, Strain CSIRO CS-38" /LENGTH=1034 /DNA_ID=CAMNT_0010608705 /DNA_START=686 /DNA_END=3790 /DNA_ORIENTATION=+
MTFEPTEINYIIELLQQRVSRLGPSSRHTSFKSDTTKSECQNFSDIRTTAQPILTRGRSVSDGTPMFSCETVYSNTPFRGISPLSSFPQKYNVGGLRYLDLSNNALNDSNCARILAAALNGPLEGLEIGNNYIHRGIAFSQTIQLLSTNNRNSFRHRLRYLGLSHNFISSKALVLLLDSLTSNTSLASLDMSWNEVDHTIVNNEALRRFLRGNEHLRSLDLCHNRLNADSYKEIHLGLLENESLLMLPMAGNQQVDISPTVNLIQIKLRENRLLYKSQTHKKIIAEEGNAFQTEEELVMRVDNIERSVERQATSTAQNYELQLSPVFGLDNFVSYSSTNLALGSLNSRSTDPSATAGSSCVDPHIKDVKVPGYSVAIAIPLDAYQNNPGIRTKMYNNGRAQILGDNCTFARIPNHLIDSSLNCEVKSDCRASDSSAGGTDNLKCIPEDLRNNSTGQNVNVNSHFCEINDKFSNNTLNVFFSAPLAGFDRNAKPHPLEMLDYTSERELLIQVFREVHRDVNVHFDFATTDSLRTALSFGCKALHFSGHGIPKGLCFEDGRMGLHVVKVSQLKDLLGAGGLQLQFVFVSACYSMEIGEAFVKAGVPHVVCVKVDTKIQDAAAIAFTRAFYVALLSGKTVKNAFAIAREALKLSPYVSDRVLEGDKFILLPDYSFVASEAQLDDFSVGANHHNKAVFPSRPVVDWPIPGKSCTMGANLVDVTSFLAANRLPTPPADFEGREVVMHSVIRHLLERRLVSIVGEDGVGKSAVAATICKYLSDREVFSDSIVYFRAKGHKNYRSFLGGMLNALKGCGCSSISACVLSAVSRQSSSSNLVYPEEEVIFTCLESLRMLLVLDNIDELIADYGESHTDFRIFLGRLFEQCPHVKVLVVSTDTLAMHNINVGFGIVEYSFLLGPLTLISTLRLFARLAPSLSSASARKEFIQALQPARQLHVSVDSRDVNNTALQILALFGDGHPAKIVHMACESTADMVEHLCNRGINIIHSSAVLNSVMSTQSTTSFTSSPAMSNNVTSTSK